MNTTPARGRDIYLIAACLAVVIAQATLVSRLRVFNASPDLLLVAVVCWSLVRGMRDGLMWAFGGGLGIDLIAGLPLGTSSLALLPIPWLGDLGRVSVFGNNALLPALLVMLATPLRGWIMLLLQQIRGIRVDWVADTVHIIGPEMILNMLLAIVVYPVVRWLTARISPLVAEI